MSCGSRSRVSLAAFVSALLADGWHVEVEGRPVRRPGTPTLAVRSGIDWFELHGWVPYGDFGADLPALLAALERGQQIVSFDDGTLGLLPEEWLRKYASIARFGAQSGDHVRFQSSQVALLDALLEAQPQVRWDDAFARARERLRDFDGIRPLDPPATFEGTLRGYQREGLGWFAFLERLGFGGCLADDMGLGKTVMVLALLDGRRAAQPRNDRRPSLVVVPRSLVFNWKEEARRFTPHLRVLDFTGAARTERFDELAGADLVLTTYGTLRRDAPRLAGVEFDYVVLDEAQAIKNAQTAAAKACRLLDARHRLALSGTPVENHLGELGSLFEFLNPGLLGRTALARLTEGGRRRRGPRRPSSRFSRAALRPFILRRTKEQVAAELPAKTEQTIFCELERPQRALYDELLRHYRRALLDASASRGSDAARSRSSKRSCACARPPATRASSTRREATTPRAKLDVLVPRILEALGRRAQGARLLAVHELSRHPARAPRRTEGGLRVPRRAHARPRQPRRAVPERPELPPLSHQPQGGRPGTEPDGGRVRLPARPVVEPCGRGAGDRPGAPHRPVAPGVRLPAHRARHGGGTRARAPAAQAPPRGGDPPRRRQPDARSPARGSRAAPVLMSPLARLSRSHERE